MHWSDVFWAIGTLETDEIEDFHIFVNTVLTLTFGFANTTLVKGLATHGQVVFSYVIIVTLMIKQIIVMSSSADGPH